MLQLSPIPERESTIASYLRAWRELPPLYGSAAYISVLALLLVLYLLSGWMGLQFAYTNSSVTALWPPSGIALASLLLLGYRVWPAILVGAFCVNWFVAHSVSASIGIAVGSTMESLLGAFLVRRFAGGLRAFDRAGSVFQFALFGGLLCTVVGATIGVSSLSLNGLASWTDYELIWLSWWLRNALGVLIVAPVLLLWLTSPLPRGDRQKITEGLALALYLLLVSTFVFGDFLLIRTTAYPLELLCIPFLVWAALRFGQQEAALAVLILSAVSIWGTLNGYGPLVGTNLNDTPLILQLFLAVLGVMTHAVAAVVSERHRVETALREARDDLAEQAISDPLTGLANYRKFVDVFDTEAERSQRTRRPFALVLFDLDDLKAINDSHGHLAGTRALCRVGNTMRVYCRTIDTAIRYGGDEFALMLPETKLEDASRVARRIATQVAGDGEEPTITVSFGVGEYPRDGRTMEAVFATADAALYQMKSRKQPRQSTRNGA